MLLCVNHVCNIRLGGPLKVLSCGSGPSKPFEGAPLSHPSLPPYPPPRLAPTLPYLSLGTICSRVHLISTSSSCGSGCNVLWVVGVLAKDAQGKTNCRHLLLCVTLRYLLGEVHAATSSSLDTDDELGPSFSLTSEQQPLKLQGEVSAPKDRPSQRSLPPLVLVLHKIYSKYFNTGPVTS